MHPTLITTARKNIQNVARTTPVLTSLSLNELTGAELFFKCENFQKTGSFKIRGAYNAVVSLTAEEAKRGVVAHSSGNFAQAVACAAKMRGIPAFLVMPENAPEIKVQGVKAFDGQITFCPATLQDREKTLEIIRQKTGATPLHPSNQLEVIIGQSTCSAELLDSHPDLDMIFTPVGGGGLLAGTGLAAHHHNSAVSVIGAEPLQCDDAYRSLQIGEIVTENPGTTIADGLRTYLGDVNFPMIQKYVEQIVRVEEEDIIEALQLIYNRLKIVVETSSAVAFAGVLKNPALVRDKKIGVILTGGNIDLNRLSEILTKNNS